MGTYSKHLSKVLLMSNEFSWRNKVKHIGTFWLKKKSSLSGAMPKGWLRPKIKVFVSSYGLCLIFHHSP